MRSIAQRLRQRYSVVVTIAGPTGTIVDPSAQAPHAEAQSKEAAAISHLLAMKDMVRRSVSPPPRNSADRGHLSGRHVAGIQTRRRKGSRSRRSAGYADGACAAARFNAPQGLCLLPDSDGCVVVADTGNHLLRLLTSTTARVSARSSSLTPYIPNPVVHETLEELMRVREEMQSIREEVMGRLQGLKSQAPEQGTVIAMRDEDGSSTAASEHDDSLLLPSPRQRSQHRPAKPQRFYPLKHEMKPR